MHEYTYILYYIHTLLYDVIHKLNDSFTYWGGAGGVLDHESQGKKIPFHSFTMKIKTFHVSRRKTHANSTMTCIKLLTNIP